MKDRLSQQLTKKGYLVVDGAMGTMLLNYGYTGNCPEKLNLEDPDLIKKIHLEYVMAGADIIETNTFGASPRKLAQFGLEDRTEEINIAAVRIAKKVAGKEVLVAGDIGPLGELCEPMGTLSFDDAYAAFSRQAKALEKGGADLLIIETMSDIQEVRAALIAAKENTKLPVICSFTFDKNGRTLTGTDFVTAALTCQALGADVISTNCGNGPEQLYTMLAERKKELAMIHIPMMLMPNAGLPVLEDGRAVYTMIPEDFGEKTATAAQLGFRIFGGCCGTTPAHIKQLQLSLAARSLTYQLKKPDPYAVVFTSRRSAYVLNKKSPLLIIGERLNPTARKAFAADIKEGKTDFLKEEAQKQQAEGAHLLDLNVGVPDIDQKNMMKKMSAVLDTMGSAPICFDSDDPEVLEVALKNYPGIALVNSVNGKEAVLKAVLPLVKKYGASTVALALDEKGIPSTSVGRMKIVRTMVHAARKQGIPASRLFIDALVMAVATETDAPRVTLDTIKQCTKFGLKTSLGVSNVSFGLPQRSIINNTFLTLAKKAGLTAAIVNPAAAKLYAKPDKDFELAKNVLLGKDPGAQAYIATMNKRKPGISLKPVAVRPSASVLDRIAHAVIDGAEEKAVPLAEEALKTERPQTILDALIKGIEQVGVLYQKGDYFLPQMVASANTMKKAFERVKRDIPAENTRSAGTVVICTVQGDIHDIGKNIVAMMLENHGFRVIDLGKDVPTERIIATVVKEKADIICLSALLTTTMREMETITKALVTKGLNVPVMVGGAVVNQGYAERIGARYSADAVGAVQVAKELCNADQ